jgi:PKD repeat protein
MKKILFFAACLNIIISSNIYAQPSEGGTPYSFKHKELSASFNSVTLAKPNMEQINREDAETELKGEMHKVGRSVYTNLNLNNSGTWTDLPNGDRIWRLKVMIPDAEALAVYYDNFWIPAGAKLYLYNENQKQILGAYTESNNPPTGYFANEMVQGESVTFEYYEPSRTKGFSIISISSIGYIYRDAHFLAKYDDNQLKDFNTSGNCEVNVNCPEGANWQDQKKGVARILVVEGGMQGFCTGSLINNVRQDCTPYFLTADHCGQSSSTSDLTQWVFYFNYESSTCITQSNEPVANTLTGCTLKSHGGNGGASGSDFFLVQLTTAPTFNPFFNGWDRSTTGSANGVSIHNPDGDILKISTYTTALVSSYYNDPGYPDTHWLVEWVATASGQGVTEPGSSGSPIFNSSKRIVGDLTGGGSSCSNLTQPDFYGKLSYSWDQNGTTAAVRLKDWLDPDNTNVMSLDGFYCGGVSTIAANFSGTPLAVPVGGTVTFTDLSTGTPTTWAWSANPSTGVTYAGGTTAASQNPQMTFANTGLYSITLTASKTGSTDTETKTNYITVGNVPPVADFVGNPLSIPVGGSVNFTDLSGGTPTAWQWTFTGSVTASSTTQNPTGIIYNTVGLYPVTLKVTNANGSDSITKANYINVSNTPQPVTPCDTLNFPLNGTAVVYSINYPGGVKGYISGTNGYSDKAKANYYVPSAPYNKLSGVLFKFGKGRKIPSSTSNVKFAVWDNTGVNGSPGATPIAIDSVYLGNIITNISGHYYTWVSFASQPLINTPVYIGVYIPTGAGDTLALITNKNGETYPSIAWEQWRNGAWYNYADSSSWKYNVAHAIFPVFCNPNASIDEFKAGDNMIVYPNPASNSINITFMDSPKSNLKVNIYNVVGQKVNSFVYDGPEKDMFNFDISHNPNGIYILSIEADNKVLTKKISILK